MTDQQDRPCALAAEALRDHADLRAEVDRLRALWRDEQLVDRCAALLHVWSGDAVSRIPWRRVPSARRERLRGRALAVLQVAAGTISTFPGDPSPPGRPETPDLATTSTLEGSDARH